MFTTSAESVQRLRERRDLARFVQANIEAHVQGVCADLAKDPDAPVRVFDPDAPQLSNAQQADYAKQLTYKVRELGPHVEPRMERGEWWLEPTLLPVQTSNGGGLTLWRCHRCGTIYNGHPAALACAHNIELRRSIGAGIFPCPAQPQRINTGNPPDGGWDDLEAGFVPTFHRRNRQRLRALLGALGFPSFFSGFRVAVNIADGLLIIQANDGRCAWETD